MLSAITFDKLVEKIIKHDSWPIQPDIHQCYDWHLGNCCGWTCNQLTSKVDGVITGSRLRWSILTQCATPQSGNRVSTSLGNSGLCWTVFARNRDTVMPAKRNGDLQTLICVLVARPRQCLTLSNLVPWQNWMAAYLGYTLRMKMLFCSWPVMVHDTHTRRRRRLPLEYTVQPVLADILLQTTETTMCNSVQYTDHFARELCHEDSKTHGVTSDVKLPSPKWPKGKGVC